MAEQLGFKFQVHMYFKHRQPPRLGEIYLQIMRESGNLYPSILASSTKRPSKAALSLFELTLEEYCQVMNEFLPQRMEFAYEGPYFEIPSRFLLNEPVEWLEEQCKPNVTYRTEMWRRYLLEENAPHWSEIFVVHR
ncbi:hypothetical protein C9374_010057 [Naegleria lovaniensis]|uniref:Uncharacterized protein n=1 Tax=Naegleria lovaniensis TaxID=51637 RepID=A0AA88GH30_NAELO|nr:uncharacterized protein C9374_010057 [Naegleria lovaniensis]KAG2375053.1 hypothetical protein C9374_010057 [Naegleria lovaniensis]